LISYILKRPQKLLFQKENVVFLKK